jgi:hypothetical protein
MSIKLIHLDLCNLLCAQNSAIFRTYLSLFAYISRPRPSRQTCQLTSLTAWGTLGACNGRSDELGVSSLGEPVGRVA